mmetsp:Transcript_2028/g.3784  ORF Transcript_2028/g.3784 Transcript_2028/m.3784 type:complete len:344 (-) Transcript_2028:40-1071(-)|eukprot:CAMPEP_0197658814 /NCGR_PEP_ID=MMETSP1338-20131121/45462_1 /TAXON_ID=43686 ORGANISM="Pelagodinium beii, Strain RCC1491" /NCGR_SAMPLE_ID=MMETSP1338 /ASSEMBLY_ACC=CAM_ASM_000754 /LENGTH=343 /DNA_ID=CAMNT_0043235473 /DNA_START=70 /DNA_END=1101 /DNA_ORIENTATION=-
MGNCQCFEGFASPKPKASFKVCICGGAGGIGQHLALLMATNPRVKELSVYDLDVSMVPAAGVAADLSHLEFPCEVKAYSLGVKERPILDLPKECLEGCSLVLVPAGVPRKPGQDRKDLMNINGNIAKMIVEACARHCPDAMIGLIVNPVNSVVPAMARLYEKKGLDPLKIVGVTTLDVVRANKFVYEETGAPVDEINVPVVGGHAGKSILPLFSQEKSSASLPLEKRKALDIRVQDAGTEVVKAKAGKGSATLSMGYAGYLLGSAVLEGLAGNRSTECAYVMSSVTDLPFFASPVTFGPSGIEKVHGLPRLDTYETMRLQEAKALLKGEIQVGLDYAESNELS